MTLISLSFSGLIYIIQSQRFFGEGLNAKTSLPLEKSIKIFWGTAELTILRAFATLKADIN